jgi:hypothetical protein
MRGMAWVALASVCLAQADSRAPRIVLEDTNAFAGELAVLPLRIGDGAAAHGIRLTLTYPRELGFVEARRSRAAAKLVVTTKPGAPADGPEATLLLEAMSSDPLPSGRVLDLVFQTSKETYEKKDLTIALGDIRLLAADGSPADLAAPSTARVTVNVPLFSCFFYMH